MLDNNTLYVKFKPQNSVEEEYFKILTYSKSGKTLIVTYKSLSKNQSWPWPIVHHYKKCNIKKFKRKCKYGSYWKQVNPEDFL